MRIDYISGRMIYILDPKPAEELEKEIDAGSTDLTRYARQAGYFKAHYEILREAYNELKQKCEHLEKQHNELLNELT